MDKNIKQETDKPITLSLTSIKHLNKIANWSLVISLIGITVLSGFIILILLYRNFIFNNIMISKIYQIPYLKNLKEIFYLIIIIIYCTPIYFLFHFSIKMKNSFKEKKSFLLDSSLKSLKRFFQIMSIYLLIGMIIFILTATMILSIIIPILSRLKFLL